VSGAPGRRLLLKLVQALLPLVASKASFHWAEKRGSTRRSSALAEYAFAIPDALDLEEIKTDLHDQGFRQVKN
jgi:hypothetical protein